MKKHIERLLGNIFLPLFLCAGLLAGCADSNASAALKEYDLGVRYLSEGNYEEAVISFTKAIEIDEKYADAYLGRAQAYVGLGTEEDLAKARQDYATAADLYEEQGEAEKAEQVRDETQSIADKEEGKIDIPDTLAGNASSENLAALEGPFPRTETSYLDDGTYCIEEYDKDGTMFKRTWFSADGIIETAYEYDKNENNTRIDFYNDDGSLDTYNIYQYDEHGNELREEAYFSDGTLSSYTNKEYDKNNRCISSEYWVIHFGVSYSTFEYDEDGNCSRVNYFNEDGSSDGYQIFEFDEYGNPVNSIRYAANGTIID